MRWDSNNGTGEIEEEISIFDGEKECDDISAIIAGNVVLVFGF